MNNTVMAVTGPVTEVEEKPNVCKMNNSEHTCSDYRTQLTTRDTKVNTANYVTMWILTSAYIAVLFACSTGRRISVPTLNESTHCSLPEGPGTADTCRQLMGDA